MSDGNVFEAFVEEGRKHFAASNLLEWAQDKIYIEVKSGQWEKFTLAGHEPLRELYLKTHVPRISVPKAAQLGVSTFSTVKAMYLGDRFGISTGYYFPTDTDVRDFVDQKFDRVIENSEYLSQLKLPDDIDNKGLKQFARFAVFFRGTESKRKVKSITVGHIVKDELD
ncbi:MAG: phage terminase large subunit family protein, partial [Leptospiraceae bacterium]|nr:phage terminase large subunit family protein [Leptospiraceae bacterium]